MLLIQQTIQQHIATLTLQRPDKRNALNPPLMTELIAAIRHAEQDADVRAIVLRGAGDHFCAGADLEWMRASLHADRKANRRDAQLISDLMCALHGVTKPLLAVVQGAAIGGGVGLVATADIVIAETQAQFGLSEVRLGLIPSVIAPYVIAKIGAAQARRYFLTGERLSATQAQGVGLVHDVVATAELEARTQQLLATILSGGPEAVRAAKQMVRGLTVQPTPKMIRETIDTIARVRVSAEAQEGMQAFLEKRPPGWMPS